MITIANTDSIVLIERNPDHKMKINLLQLTHEEAKNRLKQAWQTEGEKVFVDCDEDAFLLENRTQTSFNDLTLLWENGKDNVSSDLKSKVLEKAPDLFPMFAMDRSGTALMLAWGRPESITQAIASGKGTYFSRSRNKKWVKGEDSGHLQILERIWLSLSPFYIVYETYQMGAACHTGYYSCFFRQISEDKDPIFLYKNKIEEIK
ncbi:phosphoribosyl-AMP cyclohydrolase [Leptospira ognonensis]|nr:phosphoribosyl-AMP cyclohydrolase [Leptospira ognonensis]